ncbi:3-oxo-tetronate kinase [Sphingomonas sp. Tas61C01]|uniref:3-oxo-tetronate kinase n=1 Tax=Sphingomonas sp. Tas61C01 TaxID=3458297 RepID=UPI00403E612C
MERGGMILGVIADDFTGAGDVAGILAGAGMRTALLPTIEDVAACREDAGVVALKTRSVPVAEAVARSLAALEALRAAGARQILFKYCSTFDSTAQGNIGPVAEALALALGARGVVVCPAFPANGRTLYHGHLFVGDQLLSESGMRHHPLTPMTDSDIRRWLAAQSRGAIAHVALATVRQGADAVRRALDEVKGLVVVDAIDDMDLRSIGRAVRDAPLVTGGSAIAQGLPDNFREAGMIGAAVADDRIVSGPAILLAGSCSTATNAQVARYATDAPSHAIDVERLMAGEPVDQEARAFAVRHAAAAPLIYSTVAPAGLTRDESNAGIVAAMVERLIADLAADAVARGTRRLVVAGGETSGAVVERLAPGPLSVGRSIAPGVPLLYAGDLALALKSGNFGGEDFFKDALAVIEGRQ